MIYIHFTLQFQSVCQRIFVKVTSTKAHALRRESVQLCPVVSSCVPLVRPTFNDAGLLSGGPVKITITLARFNSKNWDVRRESSRFLPNVAEGQCFRTRGVELKREIGWRSAVFWRCLPDELDQHDSRLSGPDDHVWCERRENSSHDGLNSKGNVALKENK